MALVIFTNVLFSEKDQRKKTENDADYIDSNKHWSINSKKRRTQQKEVEPVENDNSDGKFINILLGIC